MGILRRPEPLDRLTALNLAAARRFNQLPSR
jgi:hypothetical protein